MDKFDLKKYIAEGRLTESTESKVECYRCKSKSRKGIIK